MIKTILSKLGVVLYIQIWKDRIKVTNINSKAVFDEKALVAVKTEKGKMSIAAIGNNALLMTDSNTAISKPFSHKRLLLSNFALAEKLLQSVFKTLLSGSHQIVRPRAVIHPMEKVDGGAGQLEIRAFMDLAIGAGAREVKVHQGKELPLTNFDFESLPSMPAVNDE